jgi:hypothetical protein
MAAPTASPLLSESTLLSFRTRAPQSDREKRCFREDFDDLRKAMLRGAASGEALSHEIVAKLTLGIDPDAQPRWG